MGIKSKLFVVFCLLMIISLAGSINAEESQAQQELAYSYSDASYYYPSLNSPSNFMNWKNEFCNQTVGMDFLVELPPDACSPSPVTSDLLEENDVPVLCRLTGIKINPFIEVPYIKKVTPIVQNQSKEIAYINFYPARSALGNYQFNENFQVSEGSPTLSNLGYLLIFLKQQSVEKNMSRNVSANIAVNITYDVSKTYGLSTQQFILPITTQDEWQDVYKKYSFWHGRGYLRLQSINGQNAKIAVYSKPDVPPVSVVEKREGESYSVNMPGFYCDGPSSITVDKIQIPSVKARFIINGNDFLISEGEEFADSGCIVNRITTQKYFGGEVAVSCQGRVGQGSQGEYTFTVNPLNAKIYFSDAVNKDVEKTIYTGDELEFVIEDVDTNPSTPLKEQKKEYYYIGYIGKTASISDSETKSSGSQKTKYAYSDMAVIFAVEGRTKIDENGKKEKIIDAIQDAMRSGKIYSAGSSLKQELNKDSRVNNQISFLDIIETDKDTSQLKEQTNILVLPNPLPGQTSPIIPIVYTKNLALNVKIKLISVEGPAQVYYSKEIEAEYKKVINYYQTISAQYPRQEHPEGYVYGIVALRKAAELAGYMFKQQDQIAILQSIIDKYQEIEDDYIQAEVEAARTDILLLSEGAGDNSNTIETSSGTYYASLLSIVKPGLNSQEARIKVNNSDSAVYLIGDEIGLAKIIDITEEGIAISIIDGRDDFIKKGTSKTINLTKIDVVSTLVRKEVKVTVSPFEKERTTTTNFSVVIGIEKRAIQLTPSQISKRIADLNKIINTLDKYVGFLEKTTEIWKKACYAGGTVLWAKNFLSGLSGQSLARRLAMKAWSSKCASQEYRTELGGSKAIGLSECYRKNKAGIEKDVVALTAIVNKANEFVKEVKSKPGVVSSSGLFGLSKQINEEKFILEAKSLFKSEKYSDLMQAVSIEVELGKISKSQKDSLKIISEIKDSLAPVYDKLYCESEKNPEELKKGAKVIDLLALDETKISGGLKTCKIPIPIDADSLIDSLEVVYEKGQISSDDIKDLFLMLSVNKESESISEVLKDYEAFKLFSKSTTWLDTVKKQAFSKSIATNLEISSQFWAGTKGAENALIVSEIYQMNEERLSWFVDDKNDAKDVDGQGLTSRGVIEKSYLNKEFIIFDTPEYHVLAFLSSVGDNKYQFAPAFSIEEKEFSDEKTITKLIAIKIDETIPKNSPPGTLPKKDRVIIPLGDGIPSYVWLQDIEKCHNNVNTQDYKIKFWEKGVYDGLVAQMIISRTEGWYYATKAYSGLEGTMTSYKETGALNEYWICNVGSNGKPEFNFYTGPEGDDNCCYQISKTTSMQIPEAVKALTINVEENCVKTAQASYAKKERPIKTGKCGNTQPLGSAPTLIPSTQCEDFMSPDDCLAMFNLCDPVICPPSRCDMAGRYPVENVIQSGIVGSLVLCAHNAGEVAVPVCISGLYAGLDALNNMVFKQYKECLQKQLDTGQTTGLCDYWHSVYLCQLLWGNLDPFIKAGLPLIAQSFSQGGGEYSLFSEALKNSQDSLGYFTEYYGPNAFSSFKERATNQTGKMICDKYVSIVYPTAAKFVDDLTKADSPYSIYASIEEVSLGASPESHYRVFYNIYAGKDQSVSYYVYIKKQGSSGYEYTIDQIPVRGAQGFLAPGETAADKKDILAPAGYTEVCVNANGKDHCFLGAGGTSFAISEIQNLYLESQIKQNIKTEKECKSGSPTLVPAASLNLQSQIKESLQPEIYKRGIIRICASENPAAGTEDTEKYKAIGYCDNQKISCWLDMNSVNNSISDLGIREDIAKYAEQVSEDKLFKDGLVDLPETTRSAIDNLNKKLDAARVTLYGESMDVENGVGQYNLYLNRVKEEVFRQLGLSIQGINQEQIAKAGDLESTKYSIKNHPVLKELNALAEEADKVAERALYPKDKAESAWIKSQALDERLRFLALTEVVGAQITAAEATQSGAGFNPEQIEEFSKGTVVLSEMTPKGYFITQGKLESYLKEKSPIDSPFRLAAPTFSSYFYTLGNEYGIDPAFALAVAIHESGWARSKNAQEKKNLFGISTNGVVNPYGSYEEGIKAFYKKIRDEYVSRSPPQKTPADIICFVNDVYQPNSFPNHCYCASEDDKPGCPSWFSNVPQLRKEIQNLFLSSGLSSDCVAEVEKLMSAAKERSTNGCDLTGCCGVYVWKVFQCAKKPEYGLNLGTLAWSVADVENINGNFKVFRGSSEYNPQRIIPGDIITFVDPDPSLSAEEKSGRSHRMIVGPPAEPGKYYIIDTLYLNSDKRFPDILYQENYWKDGTWLSFFQKAHRVIPACLSSASSSSSSSAANVVLPTIAPLIGIKIGSGLLAYSGKVKFDKEVNPQIWKCQTSNIFNTYYSCSSIPDAFGSPLLYAIQYRKIARELSSRDELNGYQYLKSIDGTKMDGELIKIENLPSTILATPTTPTTPTTPVPSTQPSLEIQRVMLVSRTGDQAYSTNNKLVDFNDDVEICAVVQKGSVFYSNSDVVSKNSNTKLWDGEPLKFKWYSIKALDKPSYSGARDAYELPAFGGNNDLIQYQQAELTGDGWCISQNSISTDQIGTYWYRVEIQDTDYSSLGKPATSSDLENYKAKYPLVNLDKYSSNIGTLLEPEATENAGISTNVLRVSRRSNYPFLEICTNAGYSSNDIHCEFISNVEAFRNVPFAYGCGFYSCDKVVENPSTCPTQITHLSEDFIATSCINLMISSLRKTTNQNYLFLDFEPFINQYSTKLVDKLPMEDIIHAKLTFGSGKQVDLGDVLLLSDPQGEYYGTYILYRDENKNGILDDPDLVVYITSKKVRNEGELFYAPLSNYKDPGYRFTLIKVIP